MNDYFSSFKAKDFTKAYNQAMSEIANRIVLDFQAVLQRVKESFLKQAYVQSKQACIKEHKLKIDYTSANFKLRSLQQRRKQINANFAMTRSGSKWSHHKRKSKRK